MMDLKQKKLEAIKAMNEDQLIDAVTDLIASDICDLVERVIRHRVKLWARETFKQTSGLAKS